MNEIRLIIFDLGETLLHFEGDFFKVNEEGVRAMHAFLKSSGIALDFDRLLETWTAERQKGFIRAEQTRREVIADETLRDVLRQLGVEEIDEDIIKKAVDIFFEPEIREYRPFPDAIETLKHLRDRGFQLALISNATCDRLIKRMVEMFGFSEYLDPVLSSAGVGIRKPDPAIFMEALIAAGVEPPNAVMVGDSPYHDIKGAHLTGMRGVLVHFTDNIKGLEGELKPDFIAKELSDVIRYVEMA